MILHFLCPQGHHLTAPPERAGQAGACPRCRTRFLIPDRRRTNDRPSLEEDEPLTATRLPDEGSPGGRDTERNGVEPTAERDSWPGILAGLLATGRNSRGNVAVELDDGSHLAVRDMLLTRSTGEIAVLVVEEGDRRDVVAVPWSRVRACRLKGWTAVNEVRPLGGTIAD